MSFALETSTVAEFAESAPVIAGRIGDQSTEDSQGNEPSTTTLVELQADEQQPLDQQQPVAEESTEEDWWEEIELLGQLTEIERKRQEALAKFEEITQARKDQKKIVDGLNVELQELASELVAITTGKKFPERKKAVVSQGGQTQQADAQSEASEESTAWRDTPTANLLEGVKGLGKKKIDTLAELAPTAGALEDLRATSNGVFKTVLPKGFGDKVASEIEDRLLTHQTTHDTPPASEQVKQNKPAEPELTDEERIDLEREVEQIRGEADEEEWDLETCDPHENGDCNETIEGFEAFNANKSFYTCPYGDKGERDLWLIGWVYGEHRKKLEEQGETDLEDL